MTDQWEFAELKQPLSGDAPCGENLEDSQLLASFDAYRLFGQSVPFNPAPDWREISAKAREALDRSKDFRLLAHFGAASLRTQGVFALLGTLNVAAHWLDEYWTQVYPLVDDDAILRKNALNSFADRMAVVDGLRRWAIVRHSQLGSVSLRDIDLASGQQAPSEGDGEPRDKTQLHAAFAASAIAELTALRQAVVTGLDSLKRIDTKMRNEGGSQAVPTFDPLTAQLVQLQRILTDELASHPDASQLTPADTAPAGAAPTSSGETVRPGGLGAINSRQDAIRALDAVATYFRQNEPSSPIPLFLDRAKRLVAKDFLEVLADIAPDALSQAKAAGGVHDE
jgi:type VI secretion system protein ImpA